jgi:hypothetical protein
LNKRRTTIKNNERGKSENFGGDGFFYYLDYDD